MWWVCVVWPGLFLFCFTSIFLSSRSLPTSALFSPHRLCAFLFYLPLFTCNSELFFSYPWRAFNWNSFFPHFTVVCSFFLLWSPFLFYRSVRYLLVAFPFDLFPFLPAPPIRSPLFLFLLFRLSLFCVSLIPSLLPFCVIFYPFLLCYAFLFYSYIFSLPTLYFSLSLSAVIHSFSFFCTIYRTLPLIHNFSFCHK